MEVSDINYYHVPTPTTEIMYRTGQEQGQVLDALFTLNFSKRLNLSIAYRGLRSLGQYRRSLASSGNFRTTLSYKTPKDQYTLRAHITTQDFTNQESGGLTDVMVQNFTNNDPNFLERSRLDVNLSDAENTLEGTRVFIDHTYKLFSGKDSLTSKDFINLKLGHVLTYEQKTYTFTQGSPATVFFGDAYASKSIEEETEYVITNNQGYLEFNSKYILGKFKVKANYTDVIYGYDSIYNPSTPQKTIGLAGQGVSLGASWNGTLGNLKINADANIAPGSGHLAGNNFKGEALYEKDSTFSIRASVLLNSKAPSFNYQLFQSVYTAYNWTNDFTNVETRDIGFKFVSKWGNASLHLTNIEDYTYFNQNSQPAQHDGAITYLKVKVNKAFKFGKFALNNTMMYQNVSSGSSVFRVPELVTRNTVYYMDDWFRGDPLLVQIGATFNYFSNYKANAYDPLLAEFRLQDDTEIGFPSVDVFFNARVKRTRIYFQIDNVTSGFTKKNYFSAPNYPYRDFSIRFGLVWNWFI